MQFIKEFTDIDDDLNNLKDEINTYTAIGTPKYIEQTRVETYHGALSIRSNVVEEYTLLVCIAADGDGKTSIVVNPYYTHESNALYKPGNAILFRKDLICKDDVFTGHKKIMIVDIWVSRKDTGDIVLVEFPEETKISYAVSKEQIMQFPDSMLAGFCRFKDTSEPDTKIHTYKCTDCTCDEFSVVFKVLTGTYLSVEEAETYMPLLNYFGLSDKFMVDFIDMVPSLEDFESSLCPPDFNLGLGGKCCTLCGRTSDLFDCAKCEMTHYCGKRCQTIHWKMQHSKDCCIDKISQDFVILSDEDDAAEAAKLLQPYVRFKIIYANGAKARSGYSHKIYEPMLYQMEPVYASFGDYSNLYVKNNIMHTWSSDADSNDITDYCKDDITKLKPNTKVCICYDKRDSEYRNLIVKEEMTNDNICEFCLLVAEEKEDKDIIKQIVDPDPRLVPMTGTILPSKGEPIKTFEHFHIDSANKTAFTAEQAAKMVEYIKKTELLKRIAKEIMCSNTIEPETYKSSDKDSYFSNGIAHLYVVEGLVRVS